MNTGILWKSSMHNIFKRKKREKQGFWKKHLRHKMRTQKILQILNSINLFAKTVRGFHGFITANHINAIIMQPAFHKNHMLQFPSRNRINERVCIKKHDRRRNSRSLTRAFQAFHFVFVYCWCYWFCCFCFINTTRNKFLLPREGTIYHLKPSNMFGII